MPVQTHHHNTTEYIFCYHCGARLGETVVEDHLLPTCPACGLIIYLNPKVAAGVIIGDDAGGTILLRRAIEPAYGKWTYPGGYVNRGERVEDAAMREAWEEVGLNVALTGLLGVYSYEALQVIVVVYHGKVVDGHLQAGPECLEAMWVAQSAIPWEDLAFQSTADALIAWLRLDGQPDTDWETRGGSGWENRRLEQT